MVQQRISARSHVKVKMDIPSDFVRLSAAKETAIFRIVQECLTNIHQHSGTKSAAIESRNRKEKTLVVIEDSGKGIPAERLDLIRGGRSGIGFRDMRERVRYLGDNLEIQSSNAGTLNYCHNPT